MNTRYVLPVCVAGAVHAALLFGFTKTAPATPVPKPKTDIVPFVLRVPPDEVVVVENETSDAAPKASVEAPPRTAEPLPPIDLGDKPTMRVPPVPEITNGDISKVPVDFEGGPGGTGPGRWREIVAASLLDNSPRTRFQAQPTYPFEAQRNGLSGTVQVEFMVDENGRVVDPRVVSSTDRMFEEATLRAVAKWQFEPGRRDGRVVKFRMSVPVVFNLKS